MPDLETIKIVPLSADVAELYARVQITPGTAEFRGANTDSESQGCTNARPSFNYGRQARVPLSAGGFLGASKACLANTFPEPL